MFSFAAMCSGIIRLVPACAPASASTASWSLKALTRKTKVCIHFNPYFSQRKKPSHVFVCVAAGEVGNCPYFQRRRCLFGCSAEKVAAALLVGSKAPRDDVLELAAEVQGLRRAVQRLAGTVMWDRASPAATAVAKPVVEALAPGDCKGQDLDGDSLRQRRRCSSRRACG